MRKNKNFKGMTLVEIIIALAVFAVLGVILITAGTTVDNLTRATTNLKGKLVEQSPYAANQRTVYGTNDDGTDKVLTGEQLASKINVQLGDAVSTVSGWYHVKDGSNQYVTKGSVYVLSYENKKSGKNYDAKITFNSASSIKWEIIDKSDSSIKNSGIKSGTDEANTNNLWWNVEIDKYTDAKGNVVSVYMNDVLMNGTLYTAGDGTNIKFKFKNPDMKIDAVKYDTETVYTDGMTADEIAKYNNKPNSGLNLQFIIVDEVLDE